VPDAEGGPLEPEGLSVQRVGAGEGALRVGELGLAEEARGDLGAVVAWEAANLAAMAQRGLLALLPSRRCKPRSSTLTTMPSMS